MENKIIKLPIAGGTEPTEPTDSQPDPYAGWFDNSFTIESFKRGLELLQEAGRNNLKDDLLVDHGLSGASAASWERYKKIVRGIFAARYDGWVLPQVQYQPEPLTVENSANITITLQNDSCTDNYGAMALSLASLLADKITTSVDDDGNVQICFTVEGIHAASSELDDN